MTKNFYQADNTAEPSTNDNLTTCNNYDNEVKIEKGFVFINTCCDYCDCDNRIVIVFLKAPF